MPNSKPKPLPLILAKLYRPTVGRLFVNRPRLNEKLNRGLDGQLSLVCAPAGFGKTTTVSAWIESLNAEAGDGRPAKPSAWLTLDERDGDLAIFLQYFIAALRTIFPAAGSETAELLRAVPGPSLDLLAATLSNELGALPSSFIIVLDDNATVKNRAAYDLLSALLPQWPPPLHLVLIGRYEPPLPLANLRAKGQLAELRAGDLRFTREEIGSYSALCLPESTDPAWLDHLDRVTEGWITGLHLIVRTARAQEVADPGLISFGGSIASVTDSLFDEVLTVQPAPVRTLLLKTAILDRFNATLAAAMIEQEDPACDTRACIAWIERADLFVSPQDDRGEWYRYHPLFAEFLRKRMRMEYSTEQVNHLHARAAGWFAAQGETDEALHHALAGGHLDLAAQTIEHGLSDVLDRDDPPTLERWLHLLPEALIQRRPGLLLLKAWVFQFSWQLAAQARVLDQVEALLAADAGRDPAELEYDRADVRGQVALMRCQQAYWANQPTRAIELCQEALALLPPAAKYTRGGAALYEGLAMWVRGDGDGAIQLLSERYEVLDNKRDFLALRYLLALGLIWHQAGQLERLQQTAAVMLEQAERGSLTYMHNWAYYFLGVVHYERHEYEAAALSLSHLVKHPHTIFMPLLHDSFALMARISQAQGEIEGAMQLSRHLSELDIERLGKESEVSRSLRARLHLMQGDVEAAGRWADTFTQPLPNRPMQWIENPHLTRAHILIARNRDADVATTLELLATVQGLAERTHNTRIRMECLALQALALDASGRTEDGLNALSQAVELCRPGDFTRVFVDLGPQMMAMLRRIALDGMAMETIRRILAELQRPHPNVPGNGHIAGVARVSDAVNQSLAEPLTARELEILELLRMNLSAKDIASELCLSPSTVKRHSANIFGKLGVHRRADAVARAKMLGLLANGESRPR